MISVCVPIYNYNVSALAAELSSQLNLLAGKVELIFIDDGSSENFRAVNRSFCTKTTYIELEYNLGRSKVRNLFTKYASFPYLLFLDCDSEIVGENFLQKYLEQVTGTPKVVCGGTAYSKLPPPRIQLLRWKYGKAAEAEPALIRRRNPSSYFNANNFLISQSILVKFPFNENIQLYGHEDTLFAYELKRNNITIQHIDNPVLHAGIDTNALFLAKTDQAVKNLIQITRLKKDETEFHDYVRLLRAHRSLQKSHLSRFYRLFFFICKPVIRNLLLRGMGGKRLFSLYKLGIFANHFGRLNEKDL